MKNNNQLILVLLIGILLIALICLSTNEFAKANANKLSDLDDRVGAMEDAIAQVTVNTERAALGTAVLIESIAPLPTEAIADENRVAIGFKQGHTADV